MRLWTRRLAPTLGFASILTLTGVGVGRYLSSAGPAESCPCGGGLAASTTETARVEPAGTTAAPPLATPALEVLAEPPTLPDDPLLNQRGEPVRFYSDLVKGRVVAIQFIFTTCQGICPPLGATFGTLRARFPGIQFLSVSVDPTTDTPERLAEWSRRFQAGPNWTLVTGAKPKVDHLLKALRSFDAEKNDHTPLFLIGDDRSGTWRKIHGLAAPEQVARLLRSLEDGPPPTSTTRRALDPAADAKATSGRAGGAAGTSRAEALAAPGVRYFGDATLIDQDGKALRLYSDLLRDHVVVINFFFTSCENTCPMLMGKFQELQRHFGDRLGDDLVLLSISVDPARDDVPRLATFAQKVGAKSGWHLVTAPPDVLRSVLARFGQFPKSPDQHSNLFLVGNERTKLWKKLNGMAEAARLIPLVGEVLDDREESNSPAPGAAPSGPG